MEVDELRTRLVRFCRAKYDDPDVTVDDVTTMPGHAGFAYGFAATSGGRTDRWFLRLPPPNVRWTGTADMLRQVTALQALEGSDVPGVAVFSEGVSEPDEHPASPTSSTNPSSTR